MSFSSLLRKALVPAGLILCSALFAQTGGDDAAIWLAA